ncbi:MAG: hypothetical protein ACYC3L_01050 [Gemmatimonadaceae bacterium]
MALDTATKRASATTVGGDADVFGLLLPSAGGINAVDERQAAAFAYSGIDASSSTGRGVRSDRRRRFIAAMLTRD